MVPESTPADEAVLTCEDELRVGQSDDRLIRKHRTHARDGIEISLPTRLQEVLREFLLLLEIRREREGTAGERPEALGVTVAAGPPAGGRPAGPLRLPLPREAGLAFDHAEVEWHPAGHAPADVYRQPHLDVRFFLVDGEARGSLDDGSVHTARFEFR